MIRIRKFKANDAEDLSQLILENLRRVTISDYPSEIIETLVPDYTPQRLMEKAQDHLMLVGFREGKLVGTASLDGNRIRNVYVEVARHGSGIGTILMAELESIARERNLPQLVLHAARSARGFYEKLGYQVVGELGRELAGGTMKLWRMSKDLSEAASEA